MSRLKQHRKIRDGRRSKRMLLTLQSGVVLSTMLIGGSQMTGSTYGDFSSWKSEQTVFSACEVFPSQIETIMLQIVSHLDQADSYRSQIAVISSSPSNPYTDISTEGYSSEQLYQLASELQAAVDQLGNELQSVQAQIASNELIWSSVAQEAQAAESLMNQLEQMLSGLSDACKPMNPVVEPDQLLQRVIQNVSNTQLSGDSGASEVEAAYADVIAQIQTQIGQVQSAADAQLLAEQALAELAAAEAAQKAKEAEEAEKAKEAELAEQVEPAEPAEPDEEADAGEQAEEAAEEDQIKDEAASEEKTPVEPIVEDSSEVTLEEPGEDSIAAEGEEQ